VAWACKPIFVTLQIISKPLTYRGFVIFNANIYLWKKFG